MKPTLLLIALTLAWGTASAQLVLKLESEPVPLRLTSDGKEYSFPDQQLPERTDRLRKENPRRLILSLWQPSVNIFLSYKGTRISEPSTLPEVKLDKNMAMTLLKRAYGIDPSDLSSDIDYSRQGEIRFETSRDLPQDKTLKLVEPVYTAADLDEKKFLAQFNKDTGLKASWNKTSLKVGESSLSRDGGHFQLRTRQPDKVSYISKQTQHSRFGRVFDKRYLPDSIVNFGKYQAGEEAWIRNPWNKNAIQSVLSSILRDLGADNGTFPSANISVSALKNGYYTVSVTYRDEPKSETDYPTEKITLTDKGSKYQYKGKSHTIPQSVRKFKKNNNYILEYTIE